MVFWQQKHEPYGNGSLKPPIKEAAHLRCFADRFSSRNVATECRHKRGRRIDPVDIEAEIGESFGNRDTRSAPDIYDCACRLQMV